MSRFDPDRDLPDGGDENTDPPESLAELLERIEAGDYDDDDMTDLPTFGGMAPADTAGVYSWDAESLLVGPGGARDPQRAWAIVPREDEV